MTTSELPPALPGHPLTPLEELVPDSPLPQTTGPSQSPRMKLPSRTVGLQPRSPRPSDHPISGVSYKSVVSQLPPATEEDCCLHCVLACLFCQLFSFCGTVDCGAPWLGVEPGAPACCCRGAGDGAEDCGGACALLRECCGTADCLETRMTPLVECGRCRVIQNGSHLGCVSRMFQCLPFNPK
ncbi:myoD family inhibitor domain-containing protein-like isoform X2 [Narcine bancroftii]|uniref:myoD family inhibitor domain-containing protein-like isoform X2 n=1 Tax=Narcine bancroftii TaxID=1343680 RepID=UPI0038321B02